LRDRDDLRADRTEESAQELGNGGRENLEIEIVGKEKED